MRAPMKEFPKLVDVATKKISKPLGFMYADSDSDEASVASSVRKRDFKAARKAEEAAPPLLLLEDPDASTKVDSLDDEVESQRLGRDKLPVISKYGQLRPMDEDLAEAMDLEDIVFEPLD